jgi:RNA polymerase sigma-70 factor (ECF subfamily)
MIGFCRFFRVSGEPSMATASPEEITQLLLNWEDGDQAALDKLMPLVYAELHRLAHHYMSRERLGHTIQTTALVNEVYLKLVDQRRVHWQNRAHFFAISAQLMRRILVDHARSHAYAKRGGGARKVSLEDVADLSRIRAAEIVALDEVLAVLADIDPRQSRVVELRFFGGLTIKETAEVLGLSSATIKSEWRIAKAWLYHQLSNMGCDEA